MCLGSEVFEDNDEVNRRSSAYVLGILSSLKEPGDPRDCSINNPDLLNLRRSVRSKELSKLRGDVTIANGGVMPSIHNLRWSPLLQSGGSRSSIGGHCLW